MFLATYRFLEFTKAKKYIYNYCKIRGGKDLVSGSVAEAELGMVTKKTSQYHSNNGEEHNHKYLSVIGSHQPLSLKSKNRKERINKLQDQD